MTEAHNRTWWVRIYLSGPRTIIEQACREFCEEGLCVTVEDVKFIYTGGEENGAVVGLVDYPRFPKGRDAIGEVARRLAGVLLERSCQNSVMLLDPETTTWLQRSPREPEQ
jgi:hypothetical protein